MCLLPALTPQVGRLLLNGLGVRVFALTGRLSDLFRALISQKMHKQHSCSEAQGQGRAPVKPDLQKLVVGPLLLTLDPDTSFD